MAPTDLLQVQSSYTCLGLCPVLVLLGQPSYPCPNSGLYGQVAAQTTASGKDSHTPQLNGFVAWVATMACCWCYCCCAAAGVLHAHQRGQSPGLTGMCTRHSPSYKLPAKTKSILCVTLSPCAIALVVMCASHAIMRVWDAVHAPVPSKVNVGSRMHAGS